MLVQQGRKVCSIATTVFALVCDSVNNNYLRWQKYAYACRQLPSWQQSPSAASAWPWRPPSATCAAKDDGPVHTLRRLIARPLAAEHHRARTPWPRPQHCSPQEGVTRGFIDGTRRPCSFQTPRAQQPPGGRTAERFGESLTDARDTNQTGHCKINPHT